MPFRLATTSLHVQQRPDDGAHDMVHTTWPTLPGLLPSCSRPLALPRLYTVGLGCLSARSMTIHSATMTTHLARSCRTNHSREGARTGKGTRARLGVRAVTSIWVKRGRSLQELQVRLRSGPDHDSMDRSDNDDTAITAYDTIIPYHIRSECELCDTTIMTA